MSDPKKYYWAILNKKYGDLIALAITYRKPQSVACPEMYKLEYNDKGRFNHDIPIELGSRVDSYFPKLIDEMEYSTLLAFECAPEIVYRRSYQWQTYWEIKF